LEVGLGSRHFSSLQKYIGVITIELNEGKCLK
jgi:hypothetical protein